MKSILLLSFMTLLANTFWCGRSEKEIDPVETVFNGYWNVTDLHTRRFTRNNQLIGESRQVFNSGERGFEFGEDYKEFENGNLSRKGNFSPGSPFVILMEDGDTIYTQTINFSDQSLTIQNTERDSIGYEIKLINAER